MHYLGHFKAKNRRNNYQQYQVFMRSKNLSYFLHWNVAVILSCWISSKMHQDYSMSWYCSCWNLAMLRLSLLTTWMLNFGKHKSSACKILTEQDHNLVKVGCLAHVVNNTFKICYIGWTSMLKVTVIFPHLQPKGRTWKALCTLLNLKGKNVLNVFQQGGYHSEG